MRFVIPARRKRIGGERVPRSETPEKIVFSWSWTKDTQDGPQLHPDSPETQVTVEFFARGNSTEVVLTTPCLAPRKIATTQESWNGASTRWCVFSDFHRAP